MNTESYRIELHPTGPQPSECIACHVAIQDGAPYVCKTWRTAAMTAPAFWCFCLACGLPKPGEVWRTKGGGRRVLVLEVGAEAGTVRLREVDGMAAWRRLVRFLGNFEFAGERMTATGALERVSQEQRT